jgi:hypothetical protein
MVITSYLARYGAKEIRELQTSVTPATNVASDIHWPC